MNENWEGNVSTILMWIWVLVAPYLADYFTQDQFVALGLAVVGIIIAVWSSYHPNTFAFLKNDKTGCDCSLETEEKVLNDEYEVLDEDGCQYENKYE